MHGYYDKLIDFLNHAMQEGFLYPEQEEMLIISDDPVDLLDQMAAYQVRRPADW